MKSIKEFWKEFSEDQAWEPYKETMGDKEVLKLGLWFIIGFY